MDENKLNAVREYLSDKFPENQVEEKYDFDLSAQRFKIRRDKGTLLLKVGENFLDDNSESQIKDTLNNQKIAELLAENEELYVLVSNGPPSVFKRE